MTDQVWTEPEATNEPNRPDWYWHWFPRIIFIAVVFSAAWFGSIWVFTSTSAFLLTLLISAFVALALLPGVEKLVARGWRRGAAAGVVMLIFFLIAGVFAVAMASLVVGQLISLIDAIPGYADNIAVWINDNFGVEVDIAGFIDEVTSDEEKVKELATNIAGRIFGLAGGIVGLVFQALTIGLFVFYLLADLPRLRAAINGRFSPQRQQYVDTITDITIDKVGGWVYSRGLLALFSAAFHFVVFLVLGLPYALAMALWVGIVSQFVPTVGTYLAGVVPFLVALLEDPVDAVWVLIAITVYQQIENYALSPRITANTMDLNPAVAFGSAIVGANLLGGIGALIALPFAATVTAIVQTYTSHYDLIHSERVESPEVYEARMEDKARAKQAKKKGRPWRRKKGTEADPDSGSDQTG